MSKQIDLSNNFNKLFYENKDFKIGRVLIFDGSSKWQYKIVRLNRAKRICIAEKIRLYTEDEMNEMSREEAEKIIKEGTK